MDYARSVDGSAWDEDIAKEKGRLLAAHAIANNPEQRKRVEEIYGVAYCKNRWPEAYNRSVFRSILDTMKEVILRRA